MNRHCAHVALRGQALVQPADLIGADGSAHHVGIATQERGDLRRAFLRLQRTGAIDEAPAGLEHAAGALQHFRLHERQRRNIAGALHPRHVRMTANGAGGRTGRIQQNSVEGLRLIGEGIADRDVDGQFQALEINRQTTQALG